MRILLVFLFISSTAMAFARDTNPVKCRAQALAKDSWWQSQIRLVARTGELHVKSWKTKALPNEGAFGPTIYNYMWYSVKNGKMVAQVCARCYRSWIQEDDAYQDGGAFEYLKDAVRCDRDPNFN
jgi:hypothetical protein